MKQYERVRMIRNGEIDPPFMTKEDKPVVTVTKEQQEKINDCKRVQGTYPINKVIEMSLNRDFLNWAETLNDMTPEQIVLAWHGHVEVEPEYVNLEEAIRADVKGDIVHFHPNKKSQLTFNSRESLKCSWLSEFSLKELLEGKYTIKDEPE